MSEKVTPAERVEHATQLIEDFRLQEDAEFFSDPTNRLDFLTTLDYEDFLGIAKHVNSRVRGYEPRDRRNADDKGAFLPMLATPSSEEKPDALRAGFEAIQAYLRESDDSIEEKLRGVSMAFEALIIWVHPFNDGNGRTSRFLGKFIEDGTTDVGELIEETASNDTRQRMYDSYLRVDQGNLYKNADIVSFDESDLEELQKTEMTVADGISLSLTRMLEDKRYQDRIQAQSDRYLEQRAAYEQRKAAA